MSRRVAINLAVFAVASVGMVLWALGSIVSFDRLTKPYPLHGEFLAAGGVTPNAEVTYLGVPIGVVGGVERMPGGVRVDMKINKGKTVPQGSRANIQRKSAIGEPIVDFRPPADLTATTPRMPSDATVPIALTTVPLEFSDLLRSASALIESIPPDALATVLRELAIGLEGNSDVLRGLGDSSEQFGTALESRSDTLDRLSDNNTALTRLLAQKLPTITRSLEDLDKLAKTLRAGQADTNRLLDQATPFFTSTADLVEATRPDLDCSLDVLSQVIDLTTTPQKLKELHVLTTAGPVAFGAFYDTLDIEPDGAWVRVGLVTSDVNKAKQYVPPRTIPPPVQPVVCAQSLSATPTGVDYTPTPASTLPATGRDAGLLLGMLALLAAFVVRTTARSADDARGA
jgi:phospholipid/cholesterol/gamma-HCH transport system substrate-binding protein